MEWTKAQMLLLSNISLGQKLDENSQYRTVVAIPIQDLLHSRSKSEQFFRVQVGQSSFVKVNMEMLENLLDVSVKNGYVYQNKVFKQLYPRFLKNKPCYVHVVGGLFEKAGIAKKNGGHYFLEKGLV